MYGTFQRLAWSFEIRTSQLKIINFDSKIQSDAQVYTVTNTLRSEC